MSNRLPPGRAAFSMVEVIMALGVTTMCLVTLMGLLPAGIRSDRITVRQSTAANIAGAAASDLRSAPLANAGYSPAQVLYSPRFRFALPGTGTQTLYVTEDGTPLTTVNADLPAGTATGTYRLSVVGPARPAGDGQRLASPVLILVTWPGQADPSAAALPRHYAGSFQALSYLDQN